MTPVPTSNQSAASAPSTPSAPWIAQGITAAEFWERVKEPGQPTLEELMAGPDGKP